MPLMSMKGVTKDYKLGKTLVRALRGLDMEIDKGEVVAIMGPSGSGKSTLMHMLGALDVPTNGTAMIDGSDLKELKESQLVTFRGQKVGFVFQTFNLVQTLSALQNVEMPMIFQGIGKSERIRKAKDLLTRVGLAERMKHKPNELSGGERQRVAVARALANDPEIILADEPTGNLDTESGQSILDLLKELSVNDGKTVIIVTHDPEAAAIADRIVRLRDGCVATESHSDSVARAEESKASSAGENSDGRHGTEGSKNDPSAAGSASGEGHPDQDSAARAEESKSSSAGENSEGGDSHA